DRPANGALAPIVGRKSQVPIAELCIELLQVVERTLARPHAAPALVGPPLLPATGALPGRRTELAETRSAPAPAARAAAAALDHRQQRDLEGHVSFLHLDHDVIEIAPASLDHAGNVIRTRRVPRFGLCHQGPVDILEDEALLDSIPQVAIFGA